MPENVREYKAEDIFIEDGDEYKMIIPPEILEAQGWQVGDYLRFEIGDHGTIIITKPEEDDLDDPGVVVIEKAPDGEEQRHH